jgi:hypothetical protein
MSQLAIDRHGFIGRLWKWSARWSELSAIAKIIRLNDLPMSALGQKQTCAAQNGAAQALVRFGPIPEVGLSHSSESDRIAVGQRKGAICQIA